MIIGLSGEKFAGKNTAAQILVDKYGFKELSFAAALKDICSKAFSLQKSQTEDPKLKEELFSAPLEANYWHAVYLVEHASEYLEIEDIEAVLDVFTPLLIKKKQFIHPRDILQFVGTELFRQNISENFWLDIVGSQMASADNVIITDARFENEREYIRNLGGKVALIRGGKSLPAKDRHASETGLGKEEDYDKVLLNFGSIESLHIDVENWYVSLKAMKNIGL